MSESDGEWSPWGGDDEESERPLISTGQQQHVSVYTVTLWDKLDKDTQGYKVTTRGETAYTW